MSLLPSQLRPPALHCRSINLDPASAARRHGLAHCVGLPDAGRCPSQPVLYLFVPDDSGSVIGANDPIGRRYQEIEQALTHVGQRCHCRDELATIIHYDTPVSTDVSPKSIGRRGMAGLRAGLCAPPESTYGTSCLAPALDAAFATAARHPDHCAVLVVMSDFELLDPDPYAVLDALCSFPGIVHAIVLRTDPPERLVVDERVTVTRVGWDSPTGAVAAAMFTALTHLRRGARPVAIGAPS